MSEERNSDFQERLAANQCRKERERLLAQLPLKDAAYLAGVEFITPPESSRLLPQLVPSAHGLGPTSPRRPPGYAYHAFSARQRVLNAVEAFPKEWDALPAVFCPAREVPFFRVEFGWARLRFASFFTRNPYAFYLATERLDAGIALDHYCGYPSEEFSADEIVYTIGLWHPPEASSA
jgi:hypothetical protein